MDKCPKGLTRVKVLIIGLWFCREFQAVVHRSAWLWLQRILLPSCNSWFHVPGMNDSLPVFAEFCLLLVLILSLYGYREVTSRTTMELVASPFMATSLRMRTSAWNTPELAACQWPMLAPTPTVPSSSSAQPLHHGECQIVNGRESFVFLTPFSHPSLSLSRLDGKHVVFGQVVEGLDVIKKVEAYGSSSGKTSAKIIIADCGQL